MAWENVILMVPGTNKNHRSGKQNWLCPKCESKLFTIPYYTNQAQAVAQTKSNEDEMEFLVLLCDRCGQVMAFDGCSGECASNRKSRCEICGKYYCSRCGISADIDIDEKHVELRYCNDHIPEWYKNR